MSSILESGRRGENRRRTRWIVIAAAPMLCITLAAAGCGSKAKEPAAGDAGKAATGQTETRSDAGTKAEAGTQADAGTRSEAAAKSEPETRPAAKPEEAQKTAQKSAPAAAGVGHVRLVDRGCIAFEPHWSTIQVGQSITWHSDLKQKVTIHVPVGAFDHAVFVVPAKGSTNSGPARDPGDHGMWTMPAACQAAPHGVQGAGPGVTIVGGN